MQPGDRNRVIDLLWQMNLHENAITHDRAVSRTDASLCLADIERQYAESDGALLVAEMRHEPVGFLALLFSDGDAYIRPEIRSHGYVSDLVIDEAHRGRGVAQLLLAEAEEITRANGHKVLVIGVLIGNTMAERAYTRFGFKAQAVHMLKSLG
jgi:GNAT superfamily N-acetyltransferase